MNTTSAYIINAILVLLMVRQIREHRLDLRSLAGPVLAVGAAAGSVPGGADQGVHRFAVATDAGDRRKTRSARGTVSPLRERVMDSGVYSTAGSGGPPTPSARLVTSLAAGRGACVRMALPVLRAAGLRRHRAAGVLGVRPRIGRGLADTVNRAVR